MRVTPLLVGAALLLGLLWLREHDARVLEAATARHSMDSLTAVIATDHAARAAEHTRDSLAAVRAIAERDARLAAARRAADAATARLSVLLDSLGAALPDTLGPFGVRILAEWRAHLDADLAERASAGAAIAGLKGDLAASEASRTADLAAVNRQLDEALRQLAACNRRASPGLLRRAVAALPWVAGAYLIGRVAR